jgi:hypothetical protein
MPLNLHKYWSDILRPVLTGESAPTIPQAVVLRDQDVLLVKRDSPALWELPGGGVLGRRNGWRTPCGGRSTRKQASE